MKPGIYAPCPFAPHCIRAANHPGLCGSFLDKHELTLILRHRRAYDDDFLDFDGYGDANNQQQDDRPALGSSFMGHPRCAHRRGEWGFDFENKRLMLALKDVWGASDPGLYVFFDENGELCPKGQGGMPLEVGRSTAIERPVLLLS